VLLQTHCVFSLYPPRKQSNLFKTGGDAFYAAFDTASDAVATALAAQRALHREPWPAGAKLNVRMALHSGAVEVRAGHYLAHP